MFQKKVEDARRRGHVEIERPIDELERSDSSFDKVMERLDNTPVDVPPTVDATPAQISGSGLPQPLRRYAENAEGRIEWQRLGMGASQLLIPTDDEGVTARLLRIPAGRPVPEHSHRGVELTLVLSGAYTDTTGLYGCGDFQEADAALEHQPHAIAEEDCICLAITDAPLRFKSLAARIVQPFLGI